MKLYDISTTSMSDGYVLKTKMEVQHQILNTLLAIVYISIALLLCKFCTTVYRLFKRRWFMQKLTANIDDCGLETSFIWGNLKCYPSETTKEYQDKIVEIFLRMKNYGRDWIGPFLCIVQVANPEYIKLVLSNADSKDILAFNVARDWLGDGLVASKGSKWARHRKLLTPAFHLNILKPYFKIFVDSTNVLLNKLSDTKGATVEVFEPLSLMARDSLLKCSFSYESNCQLSKTNKEHEFIWAVDTCLEIYMERLRFLPYLFDTIFHLSPSGFKWRRCIRILHSKSNNAIKKRRQEIKEVGSRREKHLDFIDILLLAQDENGDGLTDEEIREEVDTFMFGGYDTTTSAISWCLYNLARFPEYQQKCYDEVKELFDEKEHPELEWDDLNSLPFTTMFIKESLRMHSPVPGIIRVLVKEVQFPDGMVLPEGTPVAVSLLATHHNPLYWENPEVFDPYRFLPERSKDRHTHAYIPFSAGPRNCIGKNFAMMELKVAIVMIVRRFQIAVDPDHVPEWTPRIVLKSLNGIHLRFHQRLTN
ncbi:cytochrome P450 4F3-like [Amphiura filiformis]|uniref:cytochrome P450 4F3-like n=1 Tax=Amphiura filiformis TaxID=82378 RepID=UPI003B213F7E